MPAPASVLPIGRAATAAVAATSANLGPGFDSLGLALDWVDRASCEVRPEGYAVEVSGLGADRLPTGPRHIMLHAVLRGLDDLGVRAPGLLVRSHNTIPQSRGLGSSSTAIVSGLTLAWGLARPDTEPDRAWLLRHADAIEGHPDNVAAAVLGGLTIAYPADGGVDAVRHRVHPQVRACVLIPEATVPTSTARGLLPATVPHKDAAANAARAGLLVHALGDQPEALWAATHDLLHQPYRAEVMPDSHALMQRLRHAGLAAVISGAGPSVLVLGTDADLAALEGLDVRGFSVHRLGIGPGAAVET